MDSLGMHSLNETATVESTGTGVVKDSDNYRIVIGVDEAGYGPNIGPLLIAGTAWRIPKQMGESEFIETMASCFHTRAWSSGCQHVPLGDSKQLYSSSSGLRTLEAGLLAMVSLLPTAAECRCLASLLSGLDIEPERWAKGPAVPDWYAELTSEVPGELERAEVERLATLAKTSLDGCDIELVAVKALVVTEPRFNELVARLGSKGRLLSMLTMEVVSQLVREHVDVPVEIFCDRQGGRKKYACVLLEAMPDEWFETLVELPARSSYRRQRAPEMRFHFSVGGDSFPPTALASMTAKYLRERLMAVINQYWQSHLPELAPTAGYPQDAKRYRQQIEPIAMQLGYAPDQWWRTC